MGKVKNWMMDIEEACDVYMTEGGNGRCHPDTVLLYDCMEPQEVLNEIKQEFGQTGADYAETYLTKTLGEI